MPKTDKRFIVYEVEVWKHATTVSRDDPISGRIPHQFGTHEKGGAIHVLWGDQTRRIEVSTARARQAKLALINGKAII